MNHTCFPCNVHKWSPPSFLSSIHPALPQIYAPSLPPPISLVQQAPDAHTIPNPFNLGIQQSIFQAGTDQESDMPVLKHGIYTTAVLNALCFMGPQN
jgi:hypothetical protein